MLSLFILEQFQSSCISREAGLWRLCSHQPSGWRGGTGLLKTSREAAGWF
jgi:hypothetical protein